MSSVTNLRLSSNTAENLKREYWKWVAVYVFVLCNFLYNICIKVITKTYYKIYKEEQGLQRQQNDSFQSINNTYGKNVNKHGAPNLYRPSIFSDVFERRTSTEREPFFSFNSPWRYQICIAECFYSCREVVPKYMFNIKGQEYQKSNSGWHASLKNVAALTPYYFALTIRGHVFHMVLNDMDMVVGSLGILYGT